LSAEALAEEEREHFLHYSHQNQHRG